MSEYPSNYRVPKSSLISTGFTAPVAGNVITPSRSQTNPAKWSYLKFIECIYNFEKSLDDDHEIGARLPLAAEATFYIQDINYCDTQIISFSGSNENGERLQLVQHVSQLNVLLVALNKRNEEPVRIGPKLKRVSE